MLHIVRRITKLRALDPEHGNVQTFLERLLVEVVAGNYRYFLNEHLLNAADDDEEPEAYCWPPLLANERQVSGLFANALSVVCPVSRPEFTIRRPQRAPSGSAEKKAARAIEDGSGRLDFFATYGSRALALELKQIPISSLGEVQEKAGLERRWKDVKRQSAEALGYLRVDKELYPHPASVGLLVIRIQRKVTAKKSAQDARSEAAEKMGEISDGLLKALKPSFLACYSPPPEMQSFLRGAGMDERRVFPGVFFAAVVQGNLKRS